VEAGREAVRKELENVQRKMASVEDECQKKNRENLTALEQQVRVEQQAAEQRRHLETALEAARAQLADMRVELEAAHGRVEALETQLTKTEALRRDVELKLSQRRLNSSTNCWNFSRRQRGGQDALAICLSSQRSAQCQYNKKKRLVCFQEVVYFTS